MKQTLLALVLCSNITLTAQIVFTPSSNATINPKLFQKAADTGYIGIDKAIPKGNKITWNKYRYNVTVVKYDAAYKKIGENLLYNGEGDFCNFFTELIESGTKSWIVYLESSKGNTIGALKAVQIDTKTLQPMETKVLADEAEINKKVSDVGGMADLAITFKSSPDKKYHFVYINNLKKQFFAAVLDEELNTVWKGTKEIEGFKQSDLQDIIIDEAANMYIANIKGKKAVLTVFDKTSKVSQTEINFGSVKPVVIKMASGRRNGTVILAGVYSDETKNVTGIYKATVNKTTLAIENFAKTVFPEKMIERLQKDRFAWDKKKWYGISPEYVSCSVFYQDDEVIKLVTECKSYIGTGTAAAFGSIIIGSFAPSGTTLSHIPRYAVGSAATRYTDMYFAHACNNKLVLLYFDAASNIERSLDEDQAVLNGTKNAAYFAATITNDGKVTRRIINTDEKANENINRFLSTECQ